MPANNLFIALYDPGTEQVSFPYFVDEIDPPPSQKRLGRGLTEYVLRTGKALLADPDDFEELARRGEVETVGAPSIDWLGVPLIVQGKVMGVLATQTYTEGVRFGESEKDILGFVSNQVAMAIDRKRADETLRMNEARYRAIVEDQSEMINRFLPDTTLTFVNEAYCRYYGKKREELLGTSFTALLLPEDRPGVIANLSSLTPANPSLVTEQRGVKAGGIITWEQWATRAIFAENGQIVEFQSVGRDITDRKKVVDELTYLSTHDRLTGIYNRAYFEEEMVRLERGRQFPISVLMADVDGLKAVNDTYGHAAGDELLRQAAEELKTAFRAQDVVARIGGDEFGILLPGADSEVAQKSLERIHNNLEIHNSTPGKVLIQLSIGFATALRGEDLPSAYRQADAMMYQEKFQMRAKHVQEFLRGIQADQ
jgi:diguanylate cyclase (GGDEF)-like protein/PAS domain S-box-containing protein